MRISASILETIRGVGSYALIQDTFVYVPRDRIDFIAEAMLEREPLRTYRYARHAVYKAVSAIALMADEDDPASFPIARQFRRLRTPVDVAAHARQLHAELNAQVRGRGSLPRGRMTTLATEHDVAVAAECSVAYDVTGWPSSIILGPDQTFTCRSARVRMLEILVGSGSYACVDDVLWFVPTRLVGDAVRHARKTGDVGHPAAPLLETLAQIGETYADGCGEQPGLPFCRRIVRFGTMRGVIQHRSYIAAVGHYPASPTLTETDEARLHYVEGGGDRAWGESWGSDLAADEDAPN